jgi:RNA polymerase sigma-70 factor, ECF subfamily
MTFAFYRTGCAAARAPAASVEPCSDNTLLARIATGDQLAMRALYARHRVPLYRWLLRLVRDETVAEDLLSEVFFEVWRRAGSFAGRSSVSTWLLAMARYKAISAWRRRQGTEELNDSIADPGDGPEAALQKKSRDDLLRRSLVRLSPEHAEVIDLVYYHGKSVKQVAEIVGAGTATVKTRMFYARRKLAEMVAGA